MFQINEDLSIYVTRGDIARFDVVAIKGEKTYLFQPGEVIRLNVYEKKNADKVVLSKDFSIQSESEKITIILSEEETKIGGIISKPSEYWYEVVLNPLERPQTIVGYDDDGPKVLRLFPEGNDATEIESKDIPIIDAEFSMSSDRPVSNYVITRRFVENEERIKDIAEKITSKSIELVEREEFNRILSMGKWETNTVYCVIDELDTRTVADEALSKTKKLANTVKLLTLHRALYNKPGTHTFTVERSGTYKITMVGGGAGGGISPSGNTVALGGGAGAGVIMWRDLEQGDECTLIVGEKGLGLKVDENSKILSDATNGSDTKFSINGTLCATAGGGILALGERAVSTGGDLNYNGGYPQAGKVVTSVSTGDPIIRFTIGGDSLLGKGGAFENDVAGPGGGGFAAERLDGSNHKKGYDGGDGAVIIEYIS